MSDIQRTSCQGQLCQQKPQQTGQGGVDRHRSPPSSAGTSHKSVRLSSKRRTAISSSYVDPATPKVGPAGRFRGRPTPLLCLPGLLVRALLSLTPLAMVPMPRLLQAAFSAAAYSLLLLLVGLSMKGGAEASVTTENVSQPYGEAGYGYWAQGITSYPCTSPEECALLFNTSDPLRDAILLEEEQEDDDSDSSNTDEEDEKHPCVVSGHLAKSVNWYGYLATFKLRASGGRVYYRFVYPEDRCCIKILFYLDEQVLGLRARMNCLQKQSMVDPGSRQVILLSPSDPSSGCVSNKSENGVRIIECTSGRVLRSNEDRSWYIAASSCGSPTGLDLRYSFVAYGHRGKCPEVNKETNGVVSVLRRPPSECWMVLVVALVTAHVTKMATDWSSPSYLIGGTRR